jgi:hypothetical protein
MFEILALDIPKEWFAVPESIKGDQGRSPRVA